MDSALFLRSLEDGLRPVVEAAGGKLELASDPDHVFELLAISPAGWRVILSYGGDEAIDSDGSPGVVRWTLNSTVQAARGLAVKPSAHFHRQPVSGRDPLLTLASNVSAWVRGFSGSHPDLHPTGFRHLSQNWLVLDELPTRQILLTHRCILSLDDAVDVPCSFTI
jgi:hypothetical protein